jgi:hypothetical protein
MNIALEDFKTGWFGLRIGITDAEIPVLIKRLQDLQRNHAHFHLRSEFKGAGGVGDVEIFWVEPDAPHTLTIN